MKSRQSGRRVLVIRLSSLGDAVLTTPVYRNLKAAWPDCHVSVLVKPAFSPILEGHPCIDAVIPARGFRETLRAIRAGGFTHLLDLHSKLRSILLSAFSGVPNRLRYRKDILARRRFVWSRRPSPALARHTVDRYLEPLAAWGVTPAVRVPELAPDAAGAAALFEREGIPGGRLIGLHPGAAWPTKRWPAERFAELARRLAESADARVLLLGGAAEAALCERIRRLAEPAPATVLAGRTTLRELRDLMPRLSLLVSNCTGPMHVAAACGVPTVALYGPTTRELGFFPVGERTRVVEAALGCRPCTLHGDHACPEGHFLCMRLLSVDRVLAACRELLPVPAPVA